MFWNSGERDLIKGLDILGLRTQDQSVEAPLVSSITTISIRARYLSLLPWVVGEVFRDSSHKYSEKDVQRLMQIIDRLELLIILSTQHLRAQNSTLITTGMIGDLVYKEYIDAFNDRKELNAKILAESSKKKGYLSRSYATYLNPCRGFGMFSNTNATPFALPPRGQEAYQARAAHIPRDSLTLSWLLNGGKMTAGMLDDEAMLFSVGNIASIPDELECLRRSFLLPYNDEDSFVVERYRKFQGTIKWALTNLGKGNSAAQLIESNYQRCVESKYEDLTETEFLWFEYDLRRKVHYALEIILGVFSDTLADINGGIVEDVIREWDTLSGLSETISRIYGVQSVSFDKTIEDVISKLSSVSANESVGSLVPAEKCLYALALIIRTYMNTNNKVSALTNQTNRIDYLRVVFEILDRSRKSSIFSVCTNIIKQCVVVPHLNTALRKMSQGNQCSLRFYPEGQTLTPTGTATGPGMSATRLTNTMNMLADIELCDRTPNGFQPNNETGKVIERLGSIP